MKAVIMAGGFGTRIQPLTINLPKPMIPLINRPIMLHIIDLLKKHGITELILLLYHQPIRSRISSVTAANSASTSPT
jgi:mannose-1-phosphate guanylyltransferase / phosphomannomutase